MAVPTQQGSSQKKSRWHVNRKLLPIKSYYFTFIFGLGFVMPFVTIYMKQLGLTSRETGILHGSMPFIGFFVQPVFGMIADRWQKHKLMLGVFSVLCGMAYLLIITVPARDKPTMTSHTHLVCNSQHSYFRHCSHSPGDSDIGVSTCSDVGWRQIAEYVSNDTNVNSAELDCEMTCKESNKSASSEVDICFMDEADEFMKPPNECLTTRTSFTFKLLNMSSVMNTGMAIWDPDMDLNTTKAADCRHYDLKSLQHSSQHYEQLLCSKERVYICDLKCSDPPSELCQTEIEEFDITFGLMYLVYFFATLTYGPAGSMADAVTFDTLGKERHKFGVQRLWGAFGYALSAVTSTFIVYMLTKQGSDINYDVSYYIFAAISVLACGITYFMQTSPNIESGGMFTNLLGVLKIPEVLVFLVLVTFFGMVSGTIDGFLFWFLSDLGASSLVFGFSIFIMCIFELPLFFLSGKIIKRVGAVPCLYISLVVVAVRFVAYSFLINPWLVLIIEPLHGITFGLMWSACATNGAAIAPPGMTATVQGLVRGMHFGIGKGLGSLLTGFLFSQIGERWSFRVYAIAAGALLVIYVLLNQFVFKSGHTKPSVPQKSEENSKESYSNLGNDHQGEGGRDRHGDQNNDNRNNQNQKRADQGSDNLGYQSDNKLDIYTVEGTSEGQFDYPNETPDGDQIVTRL